MDVDRKKNKPSGPNYKDTVKVCPTCGAVHDLDTLICHCGYIFSVRKKTTPVRKPGELEEIGESDVAVFSEAHMRRQYEWFLMQQHTRSKRGGEPYSRGYAFMKFQSEFKQRPKRGWRDQWAEAHADLVAQDAERRLLVAVNG